MYAYIYIHTYIHIYIYIYRERERAGEIVIHLRIMPTQRLSSCSTLFVDTEILVLLYSIFISNTSHYLKLLAHY